MLDGGCYGHLPFLIMMDVTPGTDPRFETRGRDRWRIT